VKGRSELAIIAHMKVIVNGEERDLADGTTVAGLVRELGLADKPVAVEVNQDVVTRRQHETHTLTDGDHVEVVTLVGGG